MIEEIKEITEKDLPGNLKALWLKTQSAQEMKNYSYAMSLCRANLREAPGFVDARRLARKCAASARIGKKIKVGLFGGGSVSLMKIPSVGKKDPVAAMDMLEKELEKDPYHGGANDLLHDCALRLNMLETAAFALETVRKGSPENTQLLHKLAEHYLARDMPDKAADVYNDIVKNDPTDMEAIKGSKDCTARASMKKQKWDSAKSFRDVLKSSDDSAEVESSNRAAMTKEQLNEKLQKLIEVYHENNQNLSIVKEIAHLYEQLEDWPMSYSFYQYAYDLSSKDVALQNKAAFIKDKAAEFELNQLKEASEQDPANAELKKKYEDTVAARTSEKIVEAQKRVDRNPTDPQLRYELGLALFHAAKYSEAIPHLQQAKRNPHIRTRVLLILGQTFRAKHMHDLAIKQLEEALEELVGMDTTKKEVLYEKGLIHQEMKDLDAALNSFKQIYEVDYGYRDVAKRVEESYANS